MKNKKKAFSLIELLVSITIASIVITLALGTVGSVYFTQKRTDISQDFYAETRLLMEQIVQIVRNNTIDYDSYFVEVGPAQEECGNFAEAQLDEAVYDELGAENNDVNRRSGLFDYESVFYWDTDGDGEPDRNLGGYSPDLTGNDPCTQAFSGEQMALYVINGARTRRIKVQLGETEFVDKGRIKVAREIAMDDDGDLKVDRWVSNVKWDSLVSECVEDVAGGQATLGEKSEEFCESVHPETIVSPSSIDVQKLSFSLAPDRDPFLAFRNDDVQVHPHVFISLSAVLKDAVKYGIVNEGDVPKLSFQTSASSRVFGNPR